jgi:hypothetical protein
MPPKHVGIKSVEQEKKSIWPKKSTNSTERNIAMYIEIKQSKIPGAGQGAFAYDTIPKGSDLGPYRGIILTKDQMTGKYGDNGGDYIVELRVNGTTIYVDAGEPDLRRNESNWTRYINDPYNTNLRPNVQLNADGRFEALCTIPKGCELLWNYGSNYWPEQDVMELHSIDGCVCED